MVYSSIESLPEFIRKILPIEAQTYFLEVYKSALKNYDDQSAFMFAWEAIKMKMQKNGNNYVINITPVKNDVPEVFQFPVEASETSIVMNSDTEELIMEAILADTEHNTDGLKFTEVELQSIADQINMYGSTLPDVDHEKLITLVKKHGRDQIAIMNSLRNEKGIFKSIKAAVEKGKLWIQAVLDKRYKNHTDKFKALSIEAFADRDGDRLINPVYLGFTFTNTPKLPAAQVVSVV
ncbi:MAG TPA: ChaB family protein [Allocoleopsis sp.]